MQRKDPRTKTSREAPNTRPRNASPRRRQRSGKPGPQHGGHRKIEHSSCQIPCAHEGPLLVAVGQRKETQEGCRKLEATTHSQHLGGGSAIYHEKNPALEADALISYIRGGHLGKAVTAITSFGAAPVNDDTIRQVKELLIPCPPPPPETDMG